MKGTSPEDTQPLTPRAPAPPSIVRALLPRWWMRRGRWALLTIIVLTTCSLMLTLALFSRAISARQVLSSSAVKHVEIHFDGSLRAFETSASTVGDLLSEQGIEPPANSILSSRTTEPLTDGMVLSIKAPRAVTILLDGDQRVFSTALDKPLAILESAGISVGGADKIWVNDALAHFKALPAWTIPARKIRIRRSTPLTIVDGGRARTISTTAETVADALYGASVTLHATDDVSPPLESAITAAMTIRIERAITVQLHVDGVVIEARTKASTVADVLLELDAPLFALDYVAPAADATVSAGMAIEIIRVTEEVIAESEAIPFERRLQPDADIELDQRSVIQPGQAGRREARYRVRYENGAEVSRAHIETVEVQAPVAEITAYGAKIVALGAVDTPQGPRSYWRRLCVIATYYTPPPNVTATGGEVHKGVIAAKRRFIPLHTQVYVPGYGEGAILDTGAGPSSTDYWIDLGYSSETEAAQANAATRYTWIYLLWPPPADVVYLLPAWAPSRSYPSGSCS